MILLEAVGDIRGRFSSKENRAAKLLAEWSDLRNKLEGMIDRGMARTENSLLAYAVLVMMETGIRVGNEGSAEGWVCDNQIVAKKDNPEKGIKVGDVIWRHPMYGQHVQTFGLTTLLNKHVKRKRKPPVLDFTGKKLVDQTLPLHNKTLQAFLPNGPLDDLWLGVTYNSLRKFVKRYVGHNFMPKDIRTAVVNLKFSRRFGCQHAAEYAEAETKKARKAIVAECVEATANEIGHTKSVCRTAYLSKEMMDELMSADIGVVVKHKEP